MECTDVDECASANLNGCSYGCQFIVKVSRIVKATTNQPNLSIHAKCENTFGNFTCECYPGYTGDGKDCTLLDMCEESNTCAVNADCSTTVNEETHEANATCACKTGFLNFQISSVTNFTTQSLA